MTLLQDKYRKEVTPKLKEQFAFDNVMAVPRLVKIVVNCGLGEALRDKKVLEKMSQQLAFITGQKPSITRAKRAISTFKLRAGDAIGLKVTIRGKRMYDFYLKFVTISLPRVRDFRGVAVRGFDGNGSYTLGVTDQTIFPELEYGMVDRVRGFEITFVTSAKNSKETRALLELLGMPFEKK